MTERERDIESYLRRAVEKKGGLCLKITPPPTGIPDRLVLLPRGRVVWVETKRPKGGIVSPIQQYQHKKLMALGYQLNVVFTKEDVDNLMKGL